MTKTLRWLGGGIAAAMLLGLAGLFSGELAEAQAGPPSGPPHRFGGTVMLDGEGAAAGTSVTAFVDGNECGSATVRANVATGSTYTLDVPASCAENGDTVSFQVGGYDAAETGTYAAGTGTVLNLTASSGMGDPDDPGMDGDMNGDMDGDDMGEGPAEPDVDGDMGGDMDDCPDDMSDDMGDGPAEPDLNGDDMGDCPDDTDMDGDMDGDMDDMDDDMDEDPGPGKTGTGLATGGSTTSLAAILGLMALAIALGGYTYARRRS